MNVRFYLLTLVLVFMSFAAKAKQQYPQIVINSDLRVQQLSANVWLHISYQDYGGVPFPANGLFIVQDDGIVIVDTPWGDASARALVEWFSKQFKVPLKALFASHFHNDSLSGLALFNSMQVPVYVNPKTWTLVAEEKRSYLTQIEGLKMANSEVVLEGISAFYPGAAHTTDNTTYYFSKDKVLFGYCAVRSPYFRGRGNVKDSDVMAWPASIQNALVKYGKEMVVVPGHGKPGDSSLLTHTISLFENPKAK